MLTINQLTSTIIEVAMKVHTKYGPGLLESVYQAVMVHELRKKGLQVESEVEVPVNCEDVKLDVGFRADIVVENTVVIELKSVENVLPVHKKQLLTYLRLMDKKIGLLINFNVTMLKSGITRVANGLEDEN